ncbi:UDP-N-acetylmuramate dehydrogenase [Christensenellaceae bacterium OttesenSCG-928-K19]|nr:UDP-N-acetylmuramate dehydrogenase [Christensenellaceae bacterium OttesenSCG-928-K19]
MKIDRKIFFGILQDRYILENEPMNRHTTFRTGGPADMLIMPQNVGELASVFTLLKSEGVPFHIMGRGSNLLVSDKGFRGAIVKLAYGDIVANGNTLRADAGVSLKDIANKAVAHSLTGLEFAAGIPGTLGGGVCMNAGAYDGELGDLVTAVLVLKPDGQPSVLSAGQMDFSYRHSVIEEKDYTVLAVSFDLTPGDPEQSRTLMAEYADRRRQKQPLEYASAGSTFKRPEGHYAGALIEKCGLKGKNVGGAQVSEKHAGFIINTGNATSQDILSLLREVQHIVADRTDVTLEPEIKLWGEFE